MTEEKQQTEDRQQRPVTEDSDATIEITRKKKSSDGEKKKTRPPRKIKAQTSDSNPTAVSSNAAPQALVESSRIAAPFNSDSTKRDNSEASWESRVKGHLNRYKRYPGDARKRARTGTAVVTFTVNKRHFCQSFGDLQDHLILKRSCTVLNAPTSFQNTTRSI
ncbi:hypothetical protein NYV48_26235 [Escherichia coli]|nr:hypothetical protein [Escherichia coli]